MSDPASIAAAPLVAVVTPIVVQVASAIVALAVAWAASRFHAMTGATIQAAALARITAAAQSEAGALIAAAGDNLATKSIPVGSVDVARIANKIAGDLPNEMAKIGLPPNIVAARVATIVAGEIGKLQASMTAVPVEPAAAPKS